MYASFHILAAAVVLNTVMARIEFDPGYEYNAAVARASSQSDWLGRAIAAALIGAFVSGVMAFLRRGKRQEA